MATLDFLCSSAEQVAPQLLGCLLVRESNGHTLIGRIVEVEAYGQADAASHSHMGRTERNSVMFGLPGHLYVYFTYGMHYCMNVVCGSSGQGEAVLIRAIEPMRGEAHMVHNRGGRSGVGATNGPAKACQALHIDKRLNGHDLRVAPLQLITQPALGPDQVVQTTRIGISRAQAAPWRFYIRGNPYVTPVPKGFHIT